MNYYSNGCGIHDRKAKKKKERIRIKEKPLINKMPNELNI